MSARSTPGVQPRTVPPRALLVVHEATNVDADGVVEECTSNSSFAQLKSGSLVEASKRGRAEEVHTVVFPVDGSVYTEEVPSERTGTDGVAGGRLYVYLSLIHI